MTATILIAEDNDLSRDMMASVLKTRGYSVLEAIDGQSAIDVIRTRNVDMALVDINMSPKGGFQFVEYMIAQGVKLPVVIVTGDDSSDMLMRASSLGVAQVIQKPIDPARLLQTVTRLLHRAGVNPAPLAVERHESHFSPEDLMQRAIDLAAQNVKSGKGRPFGAVVADSDGRIWGEGVNGIASRVDPTAHAEVMAIRQAAERLGVSDLSACRLFCSSEPTMMGKALIISVGITKVYYGLSHEEISALSKRDDESRVRAQMTYTPREAEYEQLCHDRALALFTQGS
jgi:tRNA(Arg) A34 adenosine deaminase TadA/CheY-like chemotaxis protein